PGRGCVQDPLDRVSMGVSGARTLAKMVRLRVRLIWPEVVAIQVCVLLAAIARGLDYLIPPHSEAGPIAAIERVMPVSAWGALFLLGGVLGLIGLRFDRFPLAAAGHVLLGAVYAGFAVGALCDVVARNPI